MAKPRLSFDEIVEKLELGKYEGQFREFMHLCRRAGYNRISFNKPDMKIKACRRESVRYGTTVFASPDKFIKFTPAIWDIAIKTGVSSGKILIDCHILDQGFSEAVGAVSFVWDKGQWNTSFVYTPKEYQMLLKIWNNTRGYIWPWNRVSYLHDDYMRSLSKELDSDLGMALKISRQIYNAMYVYPLIRMPLLITDAFIKPVAIWRLKLGR